MSDPDARDGPTPAGEGARTAAEGTPVAVDVSRDRAVRATWVVLLAGPVTWFVHFMLVYLVAEAGCTGGGPGLVRLGPPVPAVVTVAATGVAALACLVAARAGHARWRASAPTIVGEAPGDDHEVERHRSLGFVGLLLSLLSLVAVLFVGAPALVFTAC